MIVQPKYTVHPQHIQHSFFYDLSGNLSFHCDSHDHAHHLRRVLHFIHKVLGGKVRKVNYGKNDAKKWKERSTASFADILCFEST